MSEPIKLKQPGEKHTLTVKRVRLLPFGNDPEIEYEGTDGSKVWVPQKSSDRQLARLNLTEETVCGRRITIRRDPNSAKGRPPFWGIYLEDGEGGPSNGGTAGVGRAPASETGAPATTQARPATRQDAERIFDAEPTGEAKKPSGYALYKQITAQVLKDMPVLYENAGVPLDAQATAAIIATVYINAMKH